MPGGVGLGRQALVHKLGGPRLNQLVMQDSGDVHHAGQRPLGRDLGKQVPQSAPVAHVTRRDLDVGAEPGELPDQLVGAVRGSAAATGQQQMPHAVRGDQMTGDQRSDPARTASDQHCARRTEQCRTGHWRTGHWRTGPWRTGHWRTGHWRAVVGCERPDQPGHAQRARADGCLRLSRGDDGGNYRGGYGCRAFGVQQDEAARVLRLGSPDQPPNGGLIKRDQLVRAGGHRVVCQDDQLRRRPAFVGQPGLHGAEYPAQR